MDLSLKAFPKLGCILTQLQQTTSENIVPKKENIAHVDNFSLLPYCFKLDPGMKMALSLVEISLIYSKRMAWGIVCLACIHFWLQTTSPL